MNPADQSQIAVAVHRGDLVSNHIEFTSDRGDNWNFPLRTPLGATISAMAWSGDGSALYLVDEVQNVARCVVFISSLSCARVGNVGAGFNFFMRHMAVDPSDPRRLFLAAVRSKLDFRFPAMFSSNDGGSTWTDITISGSLLDQAPLGGAVAYIEKVLELGDGSTQMVSTVAFGTSRGVLFLDGGLGWKLLANGLPTVTVMDMVYEPADDTLVAATLGRGVWFLQDASAAVLGIASPSWTTEISTEGPTLDFGSIRDVVVDSFSAPPDDYVGLEGDAGPSGILLD